MTQKKNRKWQYAIIIIALVLGGFLSVRLVKADAYELQQNIFFTETDEWHISLLYNGGNKFLVSYDDENEHEMWLFYDLDTGQYDVIEGEEYGTNQFLGVYNNTLWYVAFAGGTLYQYDLDTGTKIKVLDSVTSVAIKADIGKIAYTKNDNRKKIYLYDMNSKKTTHLTWTRWNTYYELLISGGTE